MGAIVVAENEDICDEALRQLTKDSKWEVLPHVVDIRKEESLMPRSYACSSGKTKGGIGVRGWKAG